MAYRGRATSAFFLFVFSVLFVSACGSGKSGGPHSVTVRWEASPATAVNRSGGGYIVYWGREPGFLPEQAVDSLRVPYRDGELAPTSARIDDLGNGTWYFRVAAFSALGGGQVSEPSASFRVELP